MNFIRRNKFKILGTALISPFALVYGAGFYYFPELRHNQSQMIKALIRTGRVAIAGARMANIYMKDDNRSIETKHNEASLILKDAFVKNAGLYLKFAQLLSSLDVVVPEEYRRNFEPLCHECPENSFQNVKHSIESSLRKPIDEVFSEFNPKPLKSASIAQVHEAVLKETGERVAVKVMHDWLQESSKGDLKVIGLFVDIGELLFPEFKFKWFSEELNQILPQELNFLDEVKNSERARQILKDKPNIYVPINHFGLCNSKIITMEFIDGFPIMDVPTLKREKFDMKKIAYTISDTFSQMIFQNGFVHSDPHQGNLLLRKVKDPKNPHKTIDQVVLLDHGLYKNLSPQFRLSYSKLWKGIITQNEELIQKSSIELGVKEDQYPLFASMITSRTYEDLMDDKKSVKERLRSPQNQEERDKIAINAAKYHRQIIQILHQMNRSLLLLLKTTDFLRTIDNKLGSPVNTFEITLDYCFNEIEKFEFNNSFWLFLLFRFEKIMAKIKLFIYKQLLPQPQLN
ncbi:ABC1 family protein (macronuclear) [Tetrahymena thermophila SB210]|uniref:ABC1 family protein n=1 Tax=Tetrahymena thermophila (strain SB210) TaxID=312017 RepID=Q24C00_TETTS|nr:ABC1 family protein [Tetrahymena thermophila SB210]EAS05302.2 ABC1 family protein [Tetrahymena thermophila SB210]|eukprot:XP_001025547.2 ABC1 family protein [Tetrahymena thermophila SB210]